MKCLAVLFLFLGLSLALPTFRSSSEAEIERFNGALAGQILSRCILQNGLTRCIENWHQSKVETQEKQISRWKSFMKALDGLNLARSMTTDLCKDLYMCKTRTSAHG